MKTELKTIKNYLNFYHPCYITRDIMPFITIVYFKKVNTEGKVAILNYLDNNGIDYILKEYNNHSFSLEICTD